MFFRPSILPIGASDTFTLRCLRLSQAEHQDMEIGSGTADLAANQKRVGPRSVVYEYA